MKKIFLILFTITMFSMEADAQLLKDLKKKVEDRTKDAVENKIAEKAGKTTENAMDKILNTNLDGVFSGKPGKMVDQSSLPDSYYFQYLYSLKMTTTQGDINFDYYLNESEPYMGIKMNSGMEMFMVMDEGNKIMVTYFNGSPMATSLDIDEPLKDDFEYGDYSFTELPNREFLGYECIGRQMENEEYKFIMYLAMDMPASFSSVFNGNQGKLPPQLQAMAEEYENGLMMYLEMEDKKGSKKKNSSGVMECVGFEPLKHSVSNR